MSIENKPNINGQVESKPNVLKKIEMVEKAEESIHMSVYERKTDTARKEMPNLDFKELNSAKKDVQNKMEAITNQNSEEYDKNLALFQSIDLIGRLKNYKDWQPELEKAAKRMVYELADANSSYKGDNEKIRNMLFYLEGAVYNLAQAKFPKELDTQHKWRKERNEEYLKEAREKIKNA